MIEKEITHKHYKEALFGRKQFMHKMKILRIEGHEMYEMCMNKISISPFDTKRWIAGDGVHTLAYGHKSDLNSWWPEYRPRLFYMALRTFKPGNFYIL